MIVRFNTTPYCVQQYAEDVSDKQGKYIDLKQQPERASELPEANEWPAFGDFLEQINRCEAFRTVGCSLDCPFDCDAPDDGQAPFVEIALDHEMIRNSREALRHLYCGHLRYLHIPVINREFELQVNDSTAQLPDGQELVSLRLWLLGPRPAVEVAFSLIVAVLKEFPIDHYLECVCGPNNVSAD
jgi:hypothetical protein